MADMTNVNDMIGNKMKSVQKGFRRHRMLVFSVIAMVVMVIIGNVLKGGVNDALSIRQGQISDIKNQIIMEENKARNVIEQVAEPNHGLSTKRWQADNQMMLEWIEPAFTWDNLDEYNEHRSWYVERLGQDHPFVKNLLVERTAQYAFQDGYSVPVDEGKGINMHISSGFESYVTGIDESSGLYSYFAMLSVASYDNNGNEGISSTRIGLLYDITQDGEIQNFRYTLINQ